jgi:hypothetical protein
MAIILALGGLLGIVGAVGGLLNRSLRQIDTTLPEIPDTDQPSDTAEQAGGLVGDAGEHDTDTTTVREPEASPR